MRELHTISIENSYGDDMLGGDFVGAGFVWANEVARATRVYNISDVVWWFESGN